MSMSNDLSNPLPESQTNEVLKNIYSRRSVRDYLPDEVKDDIIRELIRAGTYAPSAANKQPWRFAVIKNRDLINKLSDKAKELWIKQDIKSSRPELIGLVNMVSRPSFNIFFNAPLLVMIFSHPDAFSPQIDCALAAGNMMLAARSLGIGSCWIGLGAPLGQVQAIMDDLGVPSGCRLEGCLIFGYPVKLDQKAPKREENVMLKWIV